ncbi:unnamed protein product [Arctogadus glacialis]
MAGSLKTDPNPPIAPVMREDDSLHVASPASNEKWCKTNCETKCRRRIIELADQGTSQGQDQGRERPPQDGRTPLPSKTKACQCSNSTSRALPSPNSKSSGISPIPIKWQ